MTTMHEILGAAPAGSKIILSNDEVVTVDRVTAAFVFAGAYKFRKSDGQAVGGSGYIRSAKPATTEELARISRERKEQEAKRQAAKQESEAKEAALLAEAQAACGGKLPITSATSLPDGSRLVMLSLPVKAEFQRKGGFEILIARLRDVKEHDWRSDTDEQVDRVELALTNITAATHAFSSRSTATFNNDTDALWTAVQWYYHSW